MRKLILVRHSESQPTPPLPPAQWALSPAGRRRCRPLAERLAAYNLAMMLHSNERKAAETAQLVGSLLGKPYKMVEGLGEHDRSEEPYHEYERFIQLVEETLANPDAKVFGSETGAEALARFEQGIGRIAADEGPGNVAVVTHGTVLSLFVAAHSEWQPFAFWQQLAQPGYAVFSLPELSLLEVVFDAGEADPAADTPPPSL